MLKKKIKLLSLSSILLNTALFASTGQECTGGVCFATNFSPTQNYASKNHKFPTLNHKFPTLKIPQCDTTLNEDTFKNEKSDKIDKSITIVLDGQVTAIFPHSTYVMNDAEQINAHENKINNDLLLVTEMAPIEATEDKILNSTLLLPISPYFCEKDKVPLYNIDSNIYECV